MADVDGFGDWLRAAMDAARVPTASELGRSAGVSEGVISRWLKNLTQPDIPNLRRIAPVLRVPLLQLLVAAGHVSKEEAKLRDAAPPRPAVISVPDAIASDELLLDEAREHLLNQYVLLRRLSDPGEKVPAKHLKVAARRPGIPKRREQMDSEGD